MALGTLLSACSSSLFGGSPSGSTPPGAIANAGWDAWVEDFRTRAEAKGISRQTLNAAFANAGYTPDVIVQDRNQTEFNRTLEEYLAIAASDERVAKGRANYARYRNVLEQIEAAYWNGGRCSSSWPPRQ